MFDGSCLTRTGVRRSAVALRKRKKKKINENDFSRLFHVYGGGYLTKFTIFDNGVSSEVDPLVRRILRRGSGGVHVKRWFVFFVTVGFLYKNGNPRNRNNVDDQKNCGPASAPMWVSGVQGERSMVCLV